MCEDGYKLAEANKGIYLGYDEVATYNKVDIINCQNVNK